MQFSVSLIAALASGALALPNYAVDTTCTEEQARTTEAPVASSYAVTEEARTTASAPVYYSVPPAPVRSSSVEEDDCEEYETATRAPGAPAYPTGEASRAPGASAPVYPTDDATRAPGAPVYPTDDATRAPGAPVYSTKDAPAVYPTVSASVYPPVYPSGGNGTATRSSSATLSSTTTTVIFTPTSTAVVTSTEIATSTDATTSSEIATSTDATTSTTEIATSTVSAPETTPTDIPDEECGSEENPCDGGDVPCEGCDGDPIDGGVINPDAPDEGGNTDAEICGESNVPSCCTVPLGEDGLFVNAPLCAAADPISGCPTDTTYCCPLTEDNSAIDQTQQCAVINLFVNA